jgi:hypothetical protein
MPVRRASYYKNPLQKLENMTSCKLGAFTKITRVSTKTRQAQFGGRKIVRTSIA